MSWDISHHKRIKEKKKDTFGNKSKPIKKVSNKNKATFEDLEYLSWLHKQDLTCFACGRKNGIEIHHIKEASSDKKNHKEVIPLCGVNCHRLGNELSAHGTPKKFREIFPIKIQKEYAKGLYSQYKENEK